MDDDQASLPVIDNPEPEQELAACSPKVYVSNEEAALLAEMRRLRERSLGARSDLAATTNTAERERLETELTSMRKRWLDLAEERERAFRRKMIMLGHLPPDDEFTAT